MDGTNFRRILLRASTSQYISLYISFSKRGRKDTPVKNNAPIDEKKEEQETPKSLLEELIREGARRLLQAAIEQEVTEYLERFRLKCLAVVSKILPPLCLPRDLADATENTTCSRGSCFFHSVHLA